MSLKNEINLLTISGGGVRGVIPMRILVEIEKYIQEYDEFEHISDLFDLCVATSIGSVLVAGLLIVDENNKPIYTAEEMLKIFLDNVKPIFSDKWTYKVYSFFGLSGPKYSAEFWRNFIKETFKDMKLKDLRKHFIVPVINTNTNELLYIDSKDKDYEDMNLSDVLIGATSAPYYFPPHEFEFNDIKYCFIDGGISINNPGILSILKAKEHWENGENEVSCMHISLGTGYVELPKPTSGWGLYRWTYCLLDYMMHTTNMSHEYHVKYIMDAAKYYRINPKLDKDLDYFDNASIMDKYIEFIEKWMDTNKESFNSFVEKMVGHKTKAIN